MAGLVGKTTDPNQIGVLGESEQFEGVRGVSYASYHGAIVGFNENQGGNPGPGVYGGSRGKGVYGHSDQGTGVYGHSSVGIGVHGETDKGTGVLGESRDWQAGQEQIRELKKLRRQLQRLKPSSAKDEAKKEAR